MSHVTNLQKKMILESALLCLSLNIYHESRGESSVSQYAVANVTMNRAKTPSNVCRVVMEKRQFSWTTSLVVKLDGKPSLKASGIPKETQAWELAQRIAECVLANPKIDLTEGATHYHASYASPQWRHSAIRIKQMGAHIFYRMT